MLHENGLQLFQRDKTKQSYRSMTNFHTENPGATELEGTALIIRKCIKHCRQETYYKPSIQANTISLDHFST